MVGHRTDGSSRWNWFLANATSSRLFRGQKACLIDAQNSQEFPGIPIWVGDAAAKYVVSFKWDLFCFEQLLWSVYVLTLYCFLSSQRSDQAQIVAFSKFSQFFSKIN